MIKIGDIELKTADLALNKDFCDILGSPGRLLDQSKSTYRQEHPDDIVLFNACVFTKDNKEIWWGDINLTEDREKLQLAADTLNQPIILTPEQPFRWDGLTEENLETYADRIHWFFPASITEETT